MVQNNAIMMTQMGELTWCMSSKVWFESNVGFDVLGSSFLGNKSIIYSDDQLVYV